MKKHFILAAMTVAAIFTGCSNEEESLMPNANAPVSFVIDGPVTRTTTTKDGVTSFVRLRLTYSQLQQTKVHPVPLIKATL